MEDWQLLQEYAQRNSEPAFRNLVSRYVNLVHSAALRQVQDAQLAEEVTQAVFILLARKAAGFRSGMVLPGWLFRTTRFVASRAVRTEQRRQRREQEALAMQQLNTPNDTWKQISPLLDEALERLGESDRNAVLLRYFNDKTNRQAATELGISEEAAKKRVARAVDKLRRFFSTRGIALSAAALASLVTANAVQAAPASVSTGVAAKVFAVGTLGSGTLPEFVRQTLSAWRWARLKTVAGLGTAAVATALLIHWAAGPRSDAKQLAAAHEVPSESATAAPVQAPGNSPSPVQPASVAALNAEEPTLAFRVFDSQTDSGVEGARVAVNYVARSRWWAGEDQITDKNGICWIPIPPDLSRLDVGVLKNGYVQKFYTWRSDQFGPLPLTYDLKLEHAVPIGGWVQDESGRAVSGAKIVIQFPEVGDSTAREPKSERLGFIRDLVAAKTDSQGRWQCALVPTNYDRFSLKVEHPQFAATTVVLENDVRNYTSPVQHVAMKDLWALQATINLKTGIQLAGEVLDDTGQPVGGASVGVFSEFGYAQVSGKTKADGSFLLNGVSAGSVRLSASAPGLAPANQTLDVQSNLGNLVLQLKRGVTVSLRVVNEEGVGIPDAQVVAHGPQRQNADWRGSSDANGWVEIRGIPEELRYGLRFTGMASGYFYSRNQRVDLSAAEPKIVLMRELKVSGQVVDAQNGQPIALFKAIPCRSEGVAGYDRSERRFGTNGTFALTFNEMGPPFRVRIEAEGYEPTMSAPMSLEPREQFIALKLQRHDPAKDIRGIVLLPDGQPAVGADVALLTFENSTCVEQGRLRYAGSGNILARTTADGDFQFSQNPAAHSVMAVDEAGFGLARIRQAGQSVVVQLAPWGRIEGKVRTRDGKWSGRNVVLMSPYGETRLSMHFRAVSDAEGRFVLDRIPAGDFTLYLDPGIGKSFTDATSVEVRAGDTTVSQIGGHGVTVTGSLKCATSTQVDWAKQIKTACFYPRNNPRPSGFSRLSPSASVDERRAHLDLVESPEWRAWARSQRPSETLKIAADGSFVAEGLRAGEYTLMVDLTDEATDAGGNPMVSMTRPTVASIHQPLTVSEAQEQAGAEIDLGTVTLEPNKK